VRFWDTSAIVPLCVSEPVTPDVRRIASGDTALVVWWATRTECVSAFARRRREGQLAASAERQARRVLLALAAEWSEVLPGDPVRERAERLLGVHPLRAADAFPRVPRELAGTPTSPTHFRYPPQRLSRAYCLIKPGVTLRPWQSATLSRRPHGAW
jgi:hypothetical protein